MADWIAGHAYWIADGALVALVLVAAIWDVATGRVPNKLTYSSILAGLLYWPIIGYLGAGGTQAGWSSAFRGLGGAFGGFAGMFVPMFVIWLMGGIRGGDTKMAGAAGAWLGHWKTAIFAFLYACLAAGVLAVFVMIRRRIALRTLGRVWRFLWVAAIGGRPGSPADDKSAELAWTVALLLGCIWAIVERRAGTTLVDYLLGR